MTRIREILSDASGDWTRRVDAVTDPHQHLYVLFNYFPGKPGSTDSFLFLFLGRLPNLGSRPNTIGGKFPSVRPQKVSSISTKFGIQVVFDER